MKIRAAGLSDLPAIMEIINEARRNLKEQGINQWQRSYPNAGVIERDIVDGNCYVAEEEGQVAASFAVSSQYFIPSSPVHAFAMPEFTITACGFRFDSTIARSHFTGAAFTRFVVKVPAALHGFSL